MKASASSVRALVTGAGRGIGAAIAVALAEVGHPIILNYRSDDASAQAVKARIEAAGGSAELCKFDVSDAAAASAALEQLLQDDRPIGVLINNAGIARDNAFPAMSRDDWSAVTRTSLDGFFNVTQPLVMPMVRQRWGRIISIASISGTMGNRGQTNYAAAKAGLIGATKSLSFELAKRNITVNAIAPGLIDTDMLANVPVDEIKKIIPMRRLGKPEEVAALVRFLASEDAAYITGEVITDLRGLGMSRHDAVGAGHKRRVVVTGVGLTTPIGSSLDDVSHALQHGVHGIRTLPEWSSVKDLQTRLGAPAVGADLERFSRKQTRTMGRVSLLAAFATDDAIRDAGLDRTLLSSGRTGLAYGSTHGSTGAMEQFCRVLFSTGGLTGLSGSSYLKMMSHTCIANLAQCFEIRGRIVPTVSACVSASQGIGYGYEAVREGAQDIMLCGGAEELHVLHAGVFDIMFATSTRFNEAPDRSPRPFDKARDGLVVGEGAGTLVLEELEHAQKRGAKIHAELIGYGTNCDGTHVTSPSADGMAGAMQLALEDAKLAPGKIDYVNAHGTATELGDIAESQATLAVLGANTPFSSTKGFTGHTLGACGAIEAIFAIAMMRDGFLAPSRNLEELDERCAKLDYVMLEARRAAPKVVMSNNFAFGGINTSLILERQS